MFSSSDPRLVNSKVGITLKTGFEGIITNSPERERVDVFGKCLGIQGHRPGGSHFLSADGQSVILQALAALETLTPISVAQI